MVLFPRYKYNINQKCNDALVFLQKIFNDDIISIIFSNIEKEIEITKEELNYFNIDKHWKYLETFPEDILEKYFYEVPENYRLSLYNKEYLTPEKALSNRKRKIETIIRYKRNNMHITSIKRTKSCNDILAPILDDSINYKNICKYSDQELNNIVLLCNIKKLDVPALYFWPIYGKHIDEKNRNIIRNYISKSYFPKKITKTIISKFTNTI
jgi:hypothetical protein